MDYGGLHGETARFEDEGSESSPFTLNDHLGQAIVKRSRVRFFRLMAIGVAIADADDTTARYLERDRQIGRWNRAPAMINHLDRDGHCVPSIASKDVRSEVRRSVAGAPVVSTAACATIWPPLRAIASSGLIETNESD